MTAVQEKYCAVCGRRMAWRKKWRRKWDHVRYCSDACRRDGLSATDRELEAIILALLKARRSSASICPSEAARRAAGSASEAVWRPLMPAARKAARRLVVKGMAEILQRGRPVDPSKARGPIRIRLRRGT